MDNATPAQPHPLAVQRARKRMTQEALAEASGVDRTTIARIEGRVTKPLLGTMLALSDALGVRISKLIEEEDQ